MPSAEIRIRTPYAAVPCGSVTKIVLEDLENYDPRDSGALRAGFSLILGLLRRRSDPDGLSNYFHVSRPTHTTISVIMDLFRRAHA